MKQKSASLKKTVFRLAAVLLSLFALWILFEITLRGFLNYQLDLARQRAQFRFTQPEAVRILCVGDSHTAGAEAPAFQSYPDHLRLLLAAHCGGMKAEVLNFGFSGRDLTVLRKYTQACLASQSLWPDVVIVQGGLNAWDNWDYLRQYYRENGLEAPWWFRIGSRSLLAHFFDVDRLIRSRQGADYDRFVAAATLAECREFCALSAKHGMKTVFLSYAASGGEKELLLAAQMEKVAVERGVPFVHFRQPDTYEYFLAHGLRAPGGHPNAAGYEFIAQCVLHTLSRRIPQLFPCQLEDPDCLARTGISTGLNTGKAMNLRP